MVTGVGIDIVQTRRIARLVGRYGTPLLSKFLREEELREVDEKSAEHIAGIIAAKEAVIKATSSLVVKPLNFLEVSIAKSPLGAPIARVWRTSAPSDHTISISISHANEYAVAMAVCEQ